MKRSIMVSTLINNQITNNTAEIDESLHKTNPIALVALAIFPRFKKAPRKIDAKKYIIVDLESETEVPIDRPNIDGLSDVVILERNQKFIPNATPSDIAKVFKMLRGMSHTAQMSTPPVVNYAANFNPPLFGLTNPYHGNSAQPSRTGSPSHPGLPPNWDAERALVLARLNEAEQQLRELVPVILEIEKEQTARRGIGHNNPPENVDAPPVTSEELGVWIDTANVFRSELSEPAPRFNVMRLCRRILGHIGAKFSALKQWISEHSKTVLDGVGKGIGTLIGLKFIETLPSIIDVVSSHFDKWTKFLGF